MNKELDDFLRKVEFLLYDEKDPKAAIEVLDEILLIYSNSFYTLYYLMVAYYQLDKFQEALDYAENLVSLNEETESVTIEKQYNYLNLMKAKVLQENPNLDIGKSYQSPIVIIADNTSEGIKKEYQFIQLVHSQYKRVKQSLQNTESGVYDVITIEINGIQQDYYFEISSFFGNW
ncbi:MAG: hypothetical protein OEZ01_12025 [Candidatus Heimdallarchaeota archaeon]|nr:hypothetical protein [Candidatus Heimdallarchaeota archaeon]MDH5646732.1 hypothetical protein [Candidatus Heimdallarchaeota archaeon]